VASIVLAFGLSGKCPVRDPEVLNPGATTSRHNMPCWLSRLVGVWLFAGTSGIIVVLEAKRG
jgi:hypothetical protein